MFWLWAVRCSLLLRGFKISRTWLAVWNGLFAITLVGGILALRIVFPAGPEFPAVVVRPQNALAWLLLNLMFLLSPVVLLNIRAACCSLGEKASARSLAVPVFLGITLLVLLTIMSIFTNVWGYVGPVGFVFRNQFHVPFLLAAILMIGAHFLPGMPVVSAPAAPKPADKTLASATLVLVAAGLAGTWHYRPVAATAAGNQEQLTILSYNLQQGADLSGNRNWENQLALIRRINADIIGLQESDTPRPSNGNVAAAKYFGAKLGYHIYYGPNTVSGHVRHGDSVAISPEESADLLHLQRAGRNRDRQWRKLKLKERTDRFLQQSPVREGAQESFTRRNW